MKTVSELKNYKLQYLKYLLCAGLVGISSPEGIKLPKRPTSRQIEKQILDDVLDEKVYDPRIRPAGENSTGEQ